MSWIKISPDSNAQYFLDFTRYADSSFLKLKNYIPEKLLRVFDRVDSAFVSRERFTKSYAGYEDIFDRILSFGKNAEIFVP